MDVIVIALGGNAPNINRSFFERFVAHVCKLYIQEPESFRRTVVNIAHIADFIWDFPEYVSVADDVGKKSGVIIWTRGPGDLLIEGYKQRPELLGLLPFVGGLVGGGRLSNRLEALKFLEFLPVLTSMREGAAQAAATLVHFSAGDFSQDVIDLAVFYHRTGCVKGFTGHMLDRIEDVEVFDEAKCRLLLHSLLKVTPHSDQSHRKKISDLLLSALDARPSPLCSGDTLVNLKLPGPAMIDLSI